MTTGNLLKFSLALSAATAIHLGVLAYTAPSSSGARVAGEGFSVQFGGVSMAAPSAGKSEAEQAEAVAEPEAVAKPQAPPKPPPREPVPAPNPEPAAAPHPQPKPKPLREKPGPKPEEITPPAEPEPVPAEPAPDAQTPHAAAANPSSYPHGTHHEPPATPGPSDAKPSTYAKHGPTFPTASHEASPGDEKAMAASSAATAGGNSVDSNYAGEVMQHLSRLRRPRASSPGSAYVSFEISPSGAIDQIGISESSGSSRFDHEALVFVRKAAPFPPPPVGASRSFTVEIKGR
jgi:periplasmic protein TonB